MVTIHAVTTHVGCSSCLPLLQANAEMAAELGFPAAAAVTCVKPSGTVSQLCDSASGIHPRHSEYYIRRVRCNKDDPLTNFMIQVGTTGGAAPGGAALRHFGLVWLHFLLASRL